MKTIELKGNLREDLGKKSSKLLRKDEKVPCVLYGGETNVHFYVTERSLKHIIYTPHVYVIKLDVDGKKFDAIVQDMQFHPVHDRPVHIDFLEVKEDKVVKISLPVQLNGFPVGVQQGGKLNLDSRKLKVSALAKDLPDLLEIDVTDLSLGKTIKIGDLSFDNLELLDSKNAVVASVRLTRAARAVGDLAAGEEEGSEEGEAEETATEE